MNNINIRIANELHKIAKNLMAKKRDVVRNLIFTYAPQIFDEARDAGVILSKAVFHHMFGLKKYIANDNITEADVKYIECVLKLNSANSSYRKEAEKMEQQENLMEKKGYPEIKSNFMAQLESCVLIPRDFHNWITRNLGNSTSIKIRNFNYDLKNRGQYYILWRKLSSDRQKLKKITKQCKVSKGDSAIDIISSLNKLSSFIDANLNTSEQIKKPLQAIYYKIYDVIISTNLDCRGRKRRA